MKKAVAVMADGHESTSRSTSDAAGDLAERLERINATILGVCRSVHEKAYSALSAAKPKEFEIEFRHNPLGRCGDPATYQRQRRGGAEDRGALVAPPGGGRP
jgi:hypothetical protein